MISYFVRFAKRLAVLVPGLVVAYFAFSDIYPVIEERTPTIVAFLATYLLTAYVLIPALIRGIRILFPPQHIPHYCVTPDGFASDPINIGVEGTREELVRAMKAAGWHQADRKNLITGIRFFWAMILKRPYKNAPFSTLFLFGRGQDIGFQKQVKGNVRHRHHVRFWASNFMSNPDHHEHVFFWRKFRSRNTRDRTLWVGAASLDKGLALILHNFQWTHMIEPDTNAERELIIRELKAAGLIKNTRTIQIDNPYSLHNRAFMGYLHSDGKMKIATLKESK